MYNYEPKYVREVLNYRAGEIVKHGDYNRNLNLLNVAVDNNTEALKQLLNTGDGAVLNALKLDSAALRRHREHVLEDNDEQVPSSKAVYEHVEDIRSTLQNSIETINTTLGGHALEMFNINKRIQVVNSLMEQYSDRADYVERLAADLEKEFEFTHGTLHGGSAGQVLGKLSNDDLDYTWLDRIPGPRGPQGLTGANGADGEDGADGQGVPAGGTTGQVLKKRTNTDFDTEWGEAASVLVKATGAEIDTGTDDTKFATAKAIADSKLIFETDIIDNLTSTSTTDALSANQGKVLNDLTVLANCIKEASGYTTLPNGMIIQWGTFTGTGTTNFPIEFPNGCLIVMSDGTWASDSNPAYKTLSGIVSWSKTGFTRGTFGYMKTGDYQEALSTQSYRGVTSVPNFGGHSRWIAIGY